MRHGLLLALALFLEPWLFPFSNTVATGSRLFFEGAWGRGGGVGGEAQMSAAWWQSLLTWSFGSTSWQSPVQKKVTGFHGLEHVNAIKPITWKPIECRSPLWAPIDIMQAWNLHHGTASVRSDIPYAITLSLGWLCCFVERAREHAKGRGGARVFSKFLPLPK